MSARIDAVLELVSEYGDARSFSEHDKAVVLFGQIMDALAAPGAETDELAEDGLRFRWILENVDDEDVPDGGPLARLFDSVPGYEWRHWIDTCKVLQSMKKARPL